MGIERRQRGSGRQVVVKRTSRAEATRLTAAAFPGVVEVIAVRPAAGEAPGDTVEIELALVEGPTLAEAPSPDVADIAALGAALGSILAELHDRGLAHGRVTPSHVLVAEGGRPVLCGLGDGTDAAPALDVRQLGELVRWLVGRSAPAPVDDRRRVTRALRTRGPGGATQAVLDAVAPALAEDPAQRPSARALAASLDRAAAEARRVERADRVDPTVDGDADRRHVPVRAAATAALALVVAAGAALVVISPGGDGPSRSPRSPAGPAAVPATAAARPACPVVAGLRGDLDGDGCDEPLTASDGVLWSATSRVSVGRVGDVVVTGDFDCDGRATPALLRPATGEVFVFAAWATPATAVAARRAAAVAGGTGIRTVDRDGDGCDELVVDRAEGADEVVAP